MHIQMQDKTVLVTGAGKGIGYAIAKAFTEAGAKVAINDIQPPQDLTGFLAPFNSLDGEVAVFQADVSQRAEVSQMHKRIVETFGPIDILINNAGISRPQNFLDCSEQEWDQTLNTNLKSAFLCCQQVLPAMLEKAEGVIINIASELGYLGRERFTAYTASKGALITLTRSLAREFAPNIRINAIAPGPCDTDLLHAEINTPQEMEQELNLPLARFAQPEEIASTAIFLASDHARYYCGDVLSPNGGALMR